MHKLTQDFYVRHVVEVAQDLLGKTLVFGPFQGIITETEAYRGADDPASHAFKKTPRSEIMFGPPGVSYVYFIYGMYHCFNIVTEPEGQASAVLIRGLKLNNIHLKGPGKICKYLEINKTHNGLDLNTSTHFYVMGDEQQIPYTATPRIGISKATDKLWRFVGE
jgi:DNA-3-methyladenine glycosylase